MAYFLTVLYTVYSIAVKYKHKLETDSLHQVLHLSVITLLGIWHRKELDFSSL